MKNNQIRFYYTLIKINLTQPHTHTGPFLELKSSGCKNFVPYFYKTLNNSELR